MSNSFANKSWPTFLAIGIIVTGITAGIISIWSGTGAFIFIGIVIMLSLILNVNSVIAKKQSPKDFGFDVYAEFGPELRISRDTRLKEVFPEQSNEEIREWLVDFERVDKFIWRLAECGGSSKIDEAQVSKLFAHHFPWLNGRGLRTAKSRSNYLAWHEGYEKNPKKLAALLSEISA